MTVLDWHGDDNDLSDLDLLDRGLESEGKDLREVREYRQANLRKEMARYAVDAVILSDPVNIRYATGTRNMQVFSQRNAAAGTVKLTAIIARNSARTDDLRS